MSTTGGNNGDVDVDGANLQDLDVAPYAEEQAKLTEATQLLVQCGFPAFMFTVHNLIQNYYLVHQFLKPIKLLSSIKDNQELARILSLAVPTFWSSPDSATIPDLINFVTFLKTDAGRAKLSAMYMQRRLEQQGGDYLSIPDVAAVKMANNQVSDYTTRQKNLRGEFEAEISRLRRRISLLEDEMEAELEALRNRFSPVADYEAPTRGEVEAAAYDLYMRDALKKNLPYLDRGNEGYVKAVECFGLIVRDQHLAKWIREEDRDKVLMDYCKQKAIYLERIWDTKAATKLRNLVVAAGGEEALDAAVVYEFEFELPESSQGIRKRKGM